MPESDDRSVVTTITLPFGLWLNTRYSVIIIRRKMAGQNCSWKEMSRRNSGKKETFHEHNPIHMLQFFYRCFLLTVKPKQSPSVYPFPGNSIVPTFQQCRENNCVWNVSSAMECRPVLVSQFLFGEPLGMYYVLPSPMEVVFSLWWCFCFSN